MDGRPEAGRGGIAEQARRVGAILMSTPVTSRALHKTCALFALVLVLVGAYLLVGGVWLIAVGGSFVFAVFGLAYLAAAWLFWREHPLAGWLVGAAFLLALLWGLAESGLDFWPLFPRIVVPAGLAAAALALTFGLFPSQARKARWATLGSAAASALVVVAMLGGTLAAHGVISPPAGTPFQLAAGDNHPSDWTAYARTTAGTRFAPFNQINRDNVTKLVPAWTYRTTDYGSGVDQNTPLALGDTVYTCSPNDHVAALDADTGAVRWRNEPGASSPIWQRCRSLGSYDAGLADGTPCAKRIFNSTIDAHLIALDAATGKPCPDFGTDGIVDLRPGMGPIPPGFYFQTSGPLVARDRIVIGGWVVDNQQRGEPSGVIRAFSARTGELLWAWDLGNPDITKLPPAGQTYTRGTPNMWTHAAYDDTLGLIYAPLGNETPDYFSPGRNPRSAEYNSSLVALDVETGRERWHVQTTHNDIWDYDLPSQPALADIPDGKGGVDRAIMQTTKRGQIFLFNRETGAPLAPVEERPVPQTGQVPEQTLSRTQPYSTGMPVIGAVHLTEPMTWGMTIFDQLACRIQFRSMRYDGDFTPPGLDWAIEQPGNVGGMNWGSIALDPANNYAYVVDIRLPIVFKLVPRADYEKEAAPYPKVVDGHGPSPQEGTPYGIISNNWLTPFQTPCVQPPYGTVTAVDLKTRKVAWQVPAGTTEDTGPMGLVTHVPMKIGMPAYAGTSVTAGGLVFYAGFQDFYLRAYDAQTGAELWKYRLPVGSSATPMTYVSPKTGKQYVVISVGGAGHSPKVGNYVMAFALPDR